MVSVAPKPSSQGDVWLDPGRLDTVVSKPKLRVLHVFSVLSMGGAETWLISLLKYFKEHHEEIPVDVAFDILLTGGSKSIFDDEARRLGANLFYVPFTRRNLAGFAREFRRILAKGNYDAIHDHQDHIAGLHFFMGARHLPPVRIAHVHTPLYHRKQYASDWVRRAANSAGKHFLSRFATHIMGTSRQVVEEYELDRCQSRGITVGAAHCGFDITEYSGNYTAIHGDLCREFGWEESSKILLFVGRLESDDISYLGQPTTNKNPALALEIARMCMAKDQSLRLVMVGAVDTKRIEFEAQIEKWQLRRKIRFTGVRHDVPRLMSGADLLLVPSLAEGLGMVVVEAQAAGLRVLASDNVPGEAVVNSELVTFAQVDAKAEVWANKALQLINLPRLETGKCNQLVKLSPFSIENSAKRLLNVYSGH